MVVIKSIPADGTRIFGQTYCNSTSNTLTERENDEGYFMNETVELEISKKPAYKEILIYACDQNVRSSKRVLFIGNTLTRSLLNF